MMIYLKRLPNGTFKPETDKDKEGLSLVKVGESIRVKFSKPRNAHHHRLYWAVLQLVWENLPHEFGSRYPSVEALHEELKYLIGHVEVVHSISGEKIVKTKPTDFASMGQEVFNDFFERVMIEVEKYFLPTDEIIKEAKSGLLKKVF